MISYYYADVMPDGRVRACFCYGGPEVGPLQAHWLAQAEGAAVLLEHPIDWQGPSETSVLYMVDRALEWRESLPLVDVIAQVVDRIDADADAARTSVLVKTTKAEEYMQAETQARAWQESGYLGAAPPDVASWAAAKWRDKLTEQQAAESILAQADQYRALLSGIRALRLQHMEDARHADDATGARAVLATFTTELSNLMKGST